MTITVQIPEKVSLNAIYAGVHFRVRSQHKEAYREAVWASQPQVYDGLFPVHCHYHFRLSGSRLDISNHAYMVKMIEDALVANEVIPDDNQKYVAEIKVTTEYVKKGAPNEVDVTISEFVLA